MAEIRNLTRNGETFYPLTHEKAVIGMEEFKETITEQIDNYRPIEITGDVTNAPDEEDITSDANNLLKFKNRNNLYGLGKIILRRGSSFASQVTQANTIYVIQYNFDLDSGRVNIPNGSILLFEGGTLSNGTLVCADLYDVRLVYYQDQSEILSSVTLEGNFIHKACDKDTIREILVDNSSITKDVNDVLSVKESGIQNIHLNSNTVDNSSISLDTNNKISIKDGGVTGSKLNSAVVNTDDLSIVNNKIQLANRGTTDGMGKIILRKDQSFASQLTQTNTIYVIRYDFTLGANITVPTNCVLEFDGGSVSCSISTITLNLNNALLQGTPRIINCVVTNPHNNKLNFSWLGIGSDATYNTKTLTWLADEDIDWVVDVDCELNSSITVTNRINITSPFVDTSHLKTISFPNSAGLVFSANPYHEQTCIENFILIAKGNSIEYTGYAWNTYIKNLRVQSEEGNAITFANNFQVHIMDCWLYAPSGYCVDNLKGTTSSVTRVSVGPCLAAYHNCITTWISCNGVWNKDIHSNDGIVKNWYLWDLDSPNYYIELTFINCNIESVAETAILSTTNKGNAFYIKAKGLTIHSYKDKTTGKREYPIINLVDGNIVYIEGVHFSGGLDNFANGIYPIMQGGFIDNYYPLLKFDFENPIYIKAGNKEGEYTSISQSLDTTKRPSTPLEGYSYYDLTLHKQVWYNGTNYVDATGVSV